MGMLRGGGYDPTVTLKAAELSSVGGVNALRLCDESAEGCGCKAEAIHMKLCVWEKSEC